MNRAQRRAHLLIWVIVAFATAGMIGTGLWARGQTAAHLHAAAETR